MFIDRLNYLIKRNGINRSILSKEIGGKPSLISNWYSRSEANPSFLPTADAIKSIAEYFHVSSDYLLGLQDEPLMLWPEMQKTATEVGDGLSDAQRYFLKELGDITIEEAVAAVAYIHGLRAKR